MILFKPTNSATNRFAGERNTSSRRTDLLNTAPIHDHDTVGHGEGFRLAVRDIDEGDAELPLQADELGLHAYHEMSVES